jgi:hypothetical protein
MCFDKEAEKSLHLSTKASEIVANVITIIVVALSLSSTS